MEQSDAPIAQLVGLARKSGRFIQKEMARLVSVHQDARDLFLDDQGNMKPAARRLFARLAKEAQINRVGFDPDARHQDYRKGQQDLLRLMAAMIELDHRRLDELQRQYGDR